MPDIIIAEHESGLVYTQDHKQVKWPEFKNKIRVEVSSHVLSDLVAWTMDSNQEILKGILRDMW